MRVSKQLKRGLLTSAMALAFSTMPMLTTASQGQDSGIQNGVAQAAPSNGMIVNSGQDYLLTARRALAIGDIQGASEAVLQARASQADFSGQGDSPAQLDAMINRQNQLVQLYQSGSAESGYDTEAAKFLMEQAETLIKYRDFKTARVLAEQANKFTAVDFSTFSMTPDRMIQIIDLANQGAAANQGSATNQSAAATQSVAAPQVNPKAEVSRLMAQAKLHVDQNNWTKAKEFVQQAKSYNLGDDQFAKGDILPWQLDMTIDNALNLQNAPTPEIPTPEFPVANAQMPNTVAPASHNQFNDGDVARAKYDPATDATQVVPASADNDFNSGAANAFNPVAPPIPAPGPNAIVANLKDNSPNRGQQMYRSGVEAMQTNETARAREFFQLAMQYPADLDEPTQAAIRDQLSQMEAAAAVIEQRPPVAQTSAVDEEFGYGLKNKSDFARLQSEVMRERQAAERMLEDSPREALQRLSMLRTKVASAQVAAETSRPLLKMVDRDITKFQDYIERNLAQIQNAENVQEVRDNVERTRQRRLDVDQQLNSLVDDYNKLVDEHRFAEADLIVRQAEELAPNTEIVSVLREKNRVRRNQYRHDIQRSDRERRYEDSIAEMLYLPRSMTLDQPLEFDPNSDDYRERMQGRAERQASLRYSSDANRMIWNKLKNTRVEGEYKGTLAEAMDQLSRQAGLNIVFDVMALEDQGVSTEQPISAPIRNPISLESALNVILGGVGLEFAVENEVIKVTSKAAQESELVTETYYIGDLLAPLKNYRDPNQMTFMQPGGNNGYGTGGGSLNVASAGPSTLAGAAAQAALGQQLGAGGFPGAQGFGNAYNTGNNGPQRGTPTFGTVGQQPQGGITQADFQILMNLIQQTVSSDSWETNGGGNGTIQPFPPNLSLIVANSQKVQDEIRDLLKKLRELNDVQIVIEVRFVAIQDNFFERIGVDFDFSINDNSGVADPTIDGLTESIVVGNTGSSLGGATNGVFLPTNNQDIQFQQGSFSAATPAFGDFDLASAANFGFAILSDIEVFFLLQASKGSTRATVTEAPTVVMFNGQSASVNDTQQQPFVTSVQPVVGDFAVAHQPIITILPDGTNLNVTATVSADRRSVNMALVPFFSEVVEVTTFTFAGTTQTEVSTNSLLDDLLDTIDPTNADISDDEIQVTQEGVTIQLPVLATTSVNTVVSVPDGGTILMGGIKRSRESRTERGVPMLSSIPYVNRLFTNVGTGRDTTNLMLMVTPRIIIQEEEERKQIGVFGDEG